VTISQLHAYLQSLHFTNPERMDARVELICSGESNHGLPARMSEHAIERPTP